jgi:hypothetical protein
VRGQTTTLTDANLLASASLVAVMVTVVLDFMPMAPCLKQGTERIQLAWDAIEFAGKHLCLESGIRPYRPSTLVNFLD